LRPFWERLRRSGAKIEAVATDLAPAYLSLIPQVLPQAAHVFDHFHVVKLMNDKLSQLRRELYHELKDVKQRKVLKGTRWLLLKHPEHLDAEQKEPERLQEALKLNEPLTKAYYLKEDLRQIGEQENKATADVILTRWLAAAAASEVRLLREMGAMLSRYRERILNWYDYPITTAAVEGTNNKIGAIRRVRDLEFLKLKIYACKNVR
jgi:transposase